MVIVSLTFWATSSLAVPHLLFVNINHLLIKRIKELIETYSNPQQISMIIFPSCSTTFRHAKVKPSWNLKRHSREITTISMLTKRVHFMRISVDANFLKKFSNSLSWKLFHIQLISWLYFSNKTILNYKSIQINFVHNIITFISIVV